MATRRFGGAHAQQVRWLGGVKFDDVSYCLLDGKHSARSSWSMELRRFSREKRTAFMIFLANFFISKWPVLKSI